MSESTCCARACPGSYCSNCDLLVGLDGLHVVDAGEARLTVTVESPAQVIGCRACGAVASSHGRRERTLIDAPSLGRPVRLVWRKRTWSCQEPACPVGAFTERVDQMAPPRPLLSTRACWWAAAAP